MPLYTSSQTTTTSTPLVVTAVLDTEANTITYTVAAPNGITTSNTQTRDASPTLTTNVNALIRPIAAGVPGLSLAGYTGALVKVKEEVEAQAEQAAAQARATQQPVPSNPPPPPPVTEEDPFEKERQERERQLNEQEQVENETPADVGEEDPFEKERQERERQLNEQEQVENTAPVQINENVFDPRQEVTESVFDPRQEVTESVFDPEGRTPQGLVNETRSTATNQDAVSFQKAKDWRVRLTLAPSAKYLYKADKPGILGPLAQTDGVIFPYTPSVSVAYAAAYEASDLVHSNYKIYNYKSSSVDTVTITCDFTAQDTNEANYLLAVIHFFRSVTKMFYGRDQNPRNGVPPPLCYMSGLGTFQFDNHPLVVSNFTYTLPTDVDYIRAGSQTNEPGNNVSQQTPPVNNDSASSQRITSSGLGQRTPNFIRQATNINSDATYVPTKMQITITCIPIITRNDISNRFSLKDYATGALLQGSKQNGGGIW